MENESQNLTCGSTPQFTISVDLKVTFLGHFEITLPPAAYSWACLLLFKREVVFASFFKPGNFCRLYNKFFVRFGKRSLFFKNPQWQKKHVREYRAENCFSIFLICWQNMLIWADIKHLFHFKAYFQVFDTFYTSCLRAFKVSKNSVETT